MLISVQALQTHSSLHEDGQWQKLPNCEGHLPYVNPQRLWAAHPSLSSLLSCCLGCSSKP